MVYVDDMNKPYRGMIMSHMIADTKQELLEMASKIGVNIKWVQKANTYQEHFDICLKMKIKAVQYGAIQITRKQLVTMCINRKSNEKE